MFKKLFGSGKDKIEETQYSANGAPEQEELIAVISAAVYALYAGSGITPKIRCVRPTGTRPIWAAAGLLENTRPFLP